MLERPEQPWLLLPLNALRPRVRWLSVVFCTLAVLARSVWQNGTLAFVWGLPDVKYYVNMAEGRYDLVPQPFSARPLAPLLARWIAAGVHCSVKDGFTALAYSSLLLSLVTVFWLLLQSRAPRWTLPAIVAVPFWPQLLGYAGLPDPLYTALLAVLLLTLERGWLLAAAGLMFPLMLARESTSLTLLCLLIVGWRRLRWKGSLLAVASAAAGALLVRHLTAGGLPNPEQLSGGAYMVGKLLSNSMRSLGLFPWSNVYPQLCAVPGWQIAVPFGRVQSVGVCSWDTVAPLQLLWVLLTTFGLLPLVALALWRRWRPQWMRGELLTSFCLLYGAATFLLAPALGTWYVRLIGYAWPLALVAVPRLLTPSPEVAEDPLHPQSLPRWGALLGVHLLLCLLGTRLETAHALVCALGLETVGIALLVVHPAASANAPKTAKTPRLRAKIM